MSVANVFHELRSRGHYVDCGVPMSALEHLKATEHPSTSASISPPRDRRRPSLVGFLVPETADVVFETPVLGSRDVALLD